MRALLTGGIKAILAIAALSTAAHWALRVQRDPAAATPAMASLPEPATTGSIEPRRIERPAAAKAPETVQNPTAGLDQTHLAALIAGTAGPRADKPKAQQKTAKR